MKTLKSREKESKLQIMETKIYSFLLHCRKLPLCRHNETYKYNRNITLLNHLRHSVQKGGFYRPRHCISKDKVVILVPYRFRSDHLVIFLKRIHKFLISQRLEYKVVVVEQTPSDAFNRGALFNVGFLEIMKMGHWDCFIFHDVDLIPLNIQNIYDCSNLPRHMSAAINTLRFK